jgi:hypothetical protein
VRGDARHLADDHPDRLPARRQHEAHPLLDREDVGDVVRERRQVIQPVRVGNELVVGLVLGDLLHPAMEIAQVGRAAHHLLAVELEDEPQDPVRGRVRRSHVDRDDLGVEIVVLDRVGGLRPPHVARLRHP